MFLFAFIFFLKRRFIYTPWFVGNIETDPSMRGICSGWSCGADKNQIDFIDQLNSNLSFYRNNSLGTPIIDSITPLINQSFGPALCAAGSFLIFGGDKIKQNRTEGLQLLKKGAEIDAWPCHELLALLNSDENPTEHLEKAAKFGSAVAKTIMAKNLYKKGLYRESLMTLRHLVTASTVSWNRKHRAGSNFASVIRLLTFEQNYNETYDELLTMARERNLPAALWLVDAHFVGYLTPPPVKCSLPRKTA